MPFEIDFRRSGKEIRVMYFGSVTRQDIDASWEQRLRDEAAFKQACYLVADYTEASLSGLGAIEVKALSHWPRKAASINPHITIVALMAKDLHYGLSRIWRAHSDLDSLPWSMVYVNSRQELEDYLDGKTGELEATLGSEYL